jgi:hypothetical protein
MFTVFTRNFIRWGMLLSILGRHVKGMGVLSLYHASVIPWPTMSTHTEGPDLLRYSFDCSIRLYTCLVKHY